MMSKLGIAGLMGGALIFSLAACSTTNGAKDGKIKVCRKVRVTGSRLPHTECEYKDAPAEDKGPKKEPLLPTSS